MCVCVLACCVWRQRRTYKSQFSHHKGPGDWAQALMLESKCLYSSSCLGRAQPSLLWCSAPGKLPFWRLQFIVIIDFNFLPHHIKIPQWSMVSLFPQLFCISVIFWCLCHLSCSVCLWKAGCPPASPAHSKESPSHCAAPPLTSFIIVWSRSSGLSSPISFPHMSQHYIIVFSQYFSITARSGSPLFP